MITAICNMLACQMRASDAQFNMMKNLDTRMNLTFKAAQAGASGMSGIDTFARAEKNLELQNIQNYVSYMMNEQLAKSYEQLVKKEIKNFAPKFGLESNS